MKLKPIVFLSLILIVVLINGKLNIKNIEHKDKPNVIFISVDDLRPQLNCYGKKQIFSPNIDSLALSSYLYKNAVCNYPVCGASRASVLTGLRPNYKRFTNYKSRADVDAPDVMTIGKWFKKNGYYTISNGKIFHNKNDSPESWSEPAWRADKNWRDYQTQKNIDIAKENNGVANSYEIGENQINEYADSKMINKSINDIKKLKLQNQPFLLSIGFLKPHLPFNAPKKFWDLYQESKIKLATNRFQPKNSPNVSMHTYGELRKYIDIPENKDISIPDSIQRILIQGYYACVSYIDNEIGRLIDELKKNKLYDNSIIILWGDHGWQLGEHSLWAKHCNYQTSLKVPLIVKYPNQKNQIQINSIVELVDIYPTLCELCNIDKPDHLQGKSLVNLNENNKSIGYSKYHKGWTVTTNDYSYTEWRNNNSDTSFAKMMYNLIKDPNENNNISIFSSNNLTQKKFSNKIDSIVKLN